jgi:hypothetical protein
MSEAIKGGLQTRPYRIFLYFDTKKEPRKRFLFAVYAVARRIETTTEGGAAGGITEDIGIPVIKNIKSWYRLLKNRFCAA